MNNELSTSLCNRATSRKGEEVNMLGFGETAKRQMVKDAEFALLSTTKVVTFDAVCTDKGVSVGPKGPLTSSSHASDSPSDLRKTKVGTAWRGVLDESKTQPLAYEESRTSDTSSLRKQKNRLGYWNRKNKSNVRKVYVLNDIKQGEIKHPYTASGVIPGKIARAMFNVSKDTWNKHYLKLQTVIQERALTLGEVVEFISNHIPKLFWSEQFDEDMYDLDVKADLENLSKLTNAFDTLLDPSTLETQRLPIMRQQLIEGVKNNVNTCDLELCLSLLDSIMKKNTYKIIEDNYMIEAPEYFSKGVKTIVESVVPRISEICESGASCTKTSDIIYMQSGLMGSLLGVDSFSDTIERLEDRAHIVMDSIEDLTHSLHEAADKINSVPMLQKDFDIVSFIKDKMISSMTPSLESSTIDLVLGILTIGSVLLVHRKPNAFTKSLMVTVAGAFSFRLGYRLGADLANRVLKYASGPRPTHMQSGDEKEISPIISLVSNMLDVKDLTTVRGFMKGMRNLPKTTDSVVMLTEAVRTTVYWLQAGASGFTRGAIKMPLDPTGDLQAEDFTRIANDLQERHLTGRLLMTKGTTSQIVHQIRLGETIIDRLTKSKKTLLVTAVSRHIQALRRILDAIAKFTLDRSVVRPEPAVLFLTGRPGVGKSVAMDMIENCLMKHICSPMEYREFNANKSLYSFHRMKPSYWEGVTRQCKAVIYDDFLQVREIPGADTVAGEFIKLINTAPFSPDMAFGDKGSIFLEPRFVIATSNMSHVGSEAILDNGALRRRMHVQIEVDMKQEFKNDDGTINKALLPELNPDVYDFTQYEYAPNGDRKVVKRGLTLASVVTLMKDKMEHNERFSDSLSKASIEFASSLELNEIDDETESLLHFERNLDRKIESTTTNIPCNDDGGFASIMASKIKEVYGFTPTQDFVMSMVPETVKQKMEKVSRDDYGTEALNLLNVFKRKFKVDLKDADGIHHKLPEIQDIVENKTKMALDFVQRNWFGMGVVSTAIIASLCYMFGKSEELNEVESDYRHDNKQRGNTKAEYQKPMKFQNPSVHTEAAFGEFDKVGLEYIAKVKKNIFKVYYLDNQLGYALCMKDTRFIMPYHFCTHVRLAREDNDMEVTGKEILQLVSLDPDMPETLDITLAQATVNCEVFSKKDLTFFDVKCRPRADITKHFVEKDAFDVFSNNSYRKESGFLITERTLFTFDAAVYATSIDAKLMGRNIIIDDVVRYPAVTSSGDCGMPLSFYYNGILKLVGFHMAGNGRHGFAGVFTRRDIDVIYGNEAPKQKLVNNVYPTTSTLMKSSITRVQGLSPYMESKMCLPKHTKTNYMKEVAKYCRPPFDGDISLLKACAANFLDNMEENTPNQKARKVYEMEDAIFGIEDDKVFCSLDRSTGNGWPFGGKKSTIMGVNRDIKEKSRYIIPRITEMIQLYCQGCRPFVAYTDFTKDERLPIHKVENGKIRLVSASPFDYLVVTRMFFGAFSNHIMTNGVHFGVALSVNPYSDQWNFMANEMNTVVKGFDKENFAAGDFKGFDKSQVTEIMNIILDTINKWYGNDDPMANSIRELIFRDITHSIHIRGNEVTYWETSMPSGNPLTSIINSMYNHIAIRYCWASIHDKRKSSLLNFNEHVRVFVVGDDHIFSVSDEAKTYFNEYCLVPHMKEIGLTYTSDLKEDEVKEGLRKITEISFLKRSFRFECVRNKYIAPLTLETIMEIPLWTKNNSMAIACSNADVAYRELSLHPKEVFDQKTALIHKMYSSVWTPNVSDYETLQEMVLN